MRFPTHNAQWLHKSNKLINFWNTLRSLSSGSAAASLSLREHRAEPNRTEQIHDFNIHCPDKPIIPPSNYHLPSIAPSACPFPVPVSGQPIRSAPTSTTPATHINHWIFGGQLPGDLKCAVAPSSSYELRIEHGVNKTQTKLTYCRSNTFSKSLRTRAQWGGPRK